jgi:hypothetical protein
VTDKIDQMPEIFPTPSDSNPGPYFISADREAGCKWAMIVHRNNTSFFAISPKGIRYYGVPSEHEFLIPGDSEYESIRSKWKEVLQDLRSGQW